MIKVKITKNGEDLSASKNAKTARKLWAGASILFGVCTGYSIKTNSPIVALVSAASAVASLMMMKAYTPDHETTSQP